MSSIRAGLTRDGFDAVTVELPERGMGSLTRDATLVAERATALSAAYGNRTVDIIGHSRGGIVARHAAALLANEGAEVRRVVTLSSANQGFELGVLHRFMPEGMHEIRVGSPAIRSLAEQGATQDLAAVGTRGFDGVLLPRSSAQIPGAPFAAVDDGRRALGVSSVGHYGVLRDGATYEALRGMLLLP
jgi:pimeloyl-ACP methyl ester carboxylesterase